MKSFEITTMPNDKMDMLDELLTTLDQINLDIMTKGKIRSYLIKQRLQSQNIKIGSSII